MANDTSINKIDILTRVATAKEQHYETLTTKKLRERIHKSFTISHPVALKGCYLNNRGCKPAEQRIAP